MAGNSKSEDCHGKTTKNWCKYNFRAWSLHWSNNFVWDLNSSRFSILIIMCKTRLVPTK